MIRTSNSRHRRLQPNTHSIEQVRQALESAGLRFTVQRATVYSALDQLKNHPTAEEVYRHVRSDLPRISLATVYKALEALVVAGVATKLANGDSSARYDCRSEDHYHLRDTQTGQLHDLPAEFDQ